MKNYFILFSIAFILIGTNLTSAQIGSFVDVNTDEDSYNLEDVIKVSGDANSNVPFNSKVAITQLSVVDDFGNPLDKVSVGQTSKIAVDLKNLQNTKQDYLYLLQIQDKAGDIISVSWVSGTLDPQQSFQSAVTWIPQVAGTHFAKILIWDSTNNAEPLAPLMSVRLNTGSTPIIQSENQRQYNTAPVTLMVVTSNNSIILVDEIIPTSNQYSKSYPARGPLWNESETYSLVAHQQNQIDFTVFSIIPPSLPTAPVPPKPTEPEPTCGPGTVLENGICVVNKGGIIKPDVPKPPLGTGEIAAITIGSAAAVGVVLAAVKGVFGGAGTAGGTGGTNAGQATQGSQSGQTQPAATDVQIRFEVGLE